jgi:GTP-binding protein
VVALNKMDLPEVRQRWPEVAAALKKRGYESFAISAASGENVRPLLFRAYERLQEAPRPASEEELPVYRPEEDPRQFRVAREESGWRVSGRAIERAAAMTYWEHDQSIVRFQRILKTLGIEDALRAAGVKEGDSVFIGDYELEWSD